MIQYLLAGSGRYIQGEHILSGITAQMKQMGVSQPLVMGGKRALEAAWPDLKNAFDSSNLDVSPAIYSGHCTDLAVQFFADAARNCDCIIGVGGGSCLDTAKAAAYKRGVPVICIPTSAATCAATTALSVMYSEEGKQIRIDFFDREVDLVMADTYILSQAPPRLLTAGIADSFAKYCEYASPNPTLEWGRKDVGLFSGFTLAAAANEILLHQGRDAYEAIKNKTVTPALEDCIFTNLSLIGVVSGLGGFGGRGGARFAIAHALNEVMRIHFPAVAEHWLHGELVGVGILMQMRANGCDEKDIKELKELFSALDLPTSLSQLNFPETTEDLDKLCQLLLECTSLSGRQRQSAEEAIKRTA